MKTKDLKSIAQLKLSTKTEQFFISHGFEPYHLVYLGRRSYRDVKFEAIDEGGEVKFVARVPAVTDIEVKGKNVKISSDMMSELVDALRARNMIRLDLLDDLTERIDEFYSYCGCDEAHSLWKLPLTISEHNEFYERYQVISKAKSGPLKGAIASRLTVKEYSFIMDRFGLETGKPLTLKQLGEKYGGTSETAKMKLSKMIRKLRGIPSFDELFKHS